ncbi:MULTISPECIES: FadR/GntR family transcriptional regulator [Microbacterium]|uniref:FadR/GntR family transcriptional regulator n=1 Tax=Microbacterium TaxID=33882 RepID=UPI0012AD15BB|nr:MULTISPECIES: FCD domain-containing protein [Microbacterium]MCD2171319.1 FCD domain-containing protein [Microbacterium sp. JC 701]
MARATHGSLVDAIGIRIVDGDLPPGTVLTLAALEAEYAVSRTVVREAVRSLEALGLLSQRRRVGLTVREPEHWSALDTRLIGWQLAGRRRDQLIVNTTELRAAVEPVAARLSARRATDIQRGEILRLADELARLGAAGLGNSPEYLAADIAFHDLILISSGNLMLAAARAPIAAAIGGRAMHGLTPGVPNPDALDNHVATAEAIGRADADAAEEHTRLYVAAVLTEVRRTI